MYSRVVLSSHLWIPKDEMPDLRKARNLFTVVPKYSETEICLYDQRGEWFGVPLYHFRDPSKIAQSVLDRRVLGFPAELKFKSPFRPGQDILISTFDGLVKRGRTGFILQAPPGFGKTVVTVAMLARLGRTALVVVPRSNLVEQWRDRILEHTNLRPSDIGVATGGKGEWEGKKIVVALVHTLALDRFGAEFRKYFGVVAYDEVDRSVPPQTFSPVVQMFPSLYRIGVSATLKRQDGMEVVFEKHIGQCFLRGADKNRMAPKVLIHHYWGFSGNLYGKTPINRRGQLISRLADNQERNSIIAHYVKLITTSGRRVCVLSDRISQLIEVSEILLSNQWVGKEDVGFYVRRMPRPTGTLRGKTSFKETSSAYRERVANGCKVILATYGMFSIGTDIKDLAGLIYATPQSETEQSKGRIERELDGKLQPVVVDIVDVRYTMARRWADKRERQYNASGLTIKKIRS
jgi:superfamily II DNA or RNA helicase